MIVQIEPFINEEELTQLKRVIDSTFVTEAGLTKEFENLFKNYTGSKHSIAYCNGTAALYSIIKALGIGPGDEVIVPDLTFIATANAVIMTGAMPVFCDVNEKDYGLNLENLERLVNEKTKAVIIVHLYGISANIKDVVDFCERKKMYVIEDAAQGVGVKFDDRHVGTFGIAGILSFYGNKTITCGEGGLILTNNDNIATECYRIKNHGRDKKGIFIHDQIGFNFSFTEMQAAIGISQFYKLERIIERKKYIYDFYSSKLCNVNQVSIQQVPEKVNPVHWFTNIFTEDAEDLAEFLIKKEIQTRRFFYPLHLQPCYKEIKITGNFPVTNSLYKQGLSLPSSYNITDEQLSFISENIKEFFRS